MPVGATPGGWVNIAGQVRGRGPERQQGAQEAGQRFPAAAVPGERLHRPADAEGLLDPGRPERARPRTTTCRTWASSTAATRCVLNGNKQQVQLVVVGRPAADRQDGPVPVEGGRLVPVQAGRRAEGRHGRGPRQGLAAGPAGAGGVDGRGDRPAAEPRGQPGPVRLRDRHPGRGRRRLAGAIGAEAYYDNVSVTPQATVREVADEVNSHRTTPLREQIAEEAERRNIHERISATRFCRVLAAARRRLWRRASRSVPSDHRRRAGRPASPAVHVRRHAPSRNMVNLDREEHRPTSGTSQSGKKNIKWTAKLGSRAYGGPVDRRRQGLRRHQQPAPAQSARRPQAQGRQDRADRQERPHVLRRGHRQVPLAARQRQAARPARSTTGRTRASAPRPAVEGNRSTTSPTAARSSAWTPTASPTATRACRTSSTRTRPTPT